MKNAKLVRFPAGPRIRREHTLDVAATVMPLLRAAQAEGNATLLRDLFAVLGDFAAGGNAHARLGAIRMKHGEVVPLRPAPGS